MDYIKDFVTCPATLQATGMPTVFWTTLQFRCKNSLNSFKFDRVAVEKHVLKKLVSVEIKQRMAALLIAYRRFPVQITC